MPTQHARVVAMTLVPSLAASLAACRAAGPTAVAVDDRTSRTLSADAGAEIRITLGTVGPGEYASPPDVSSPSVRFVDMTYVGPAVPAGPRQLFRFRAVSQGRAVVVFRHTGSNPTVQDTIAVR